MKFIEYYNRMVEKFRGRKQFTEISADKKRIVWPNGTGVYCIWGKMDNLERKLIYVGLAGTFKSYDSDKAEITGNFTERRSRYTPYKFCDRDNPRYKFHFRYGCNYSGEDRSKMQNSDDAYQVSIPYDNLIIHCFHIGSEHKTLTPRLLEVKLLTKFLKENQGLPPANQEL